MTEEEKQLLLKDLCARLPYGIILDIDTTDWKVPQGHIQLKIEGIGIIFKDLSLIVNGSYYGDKYKPYLRSMANMTEGEKEELRQEHLKDEKLYAECITRSEQGDNSMRGKVIPHFAADWCNKHHFDYRGLIEMNLALEAPEGMYKK
jgi:hypothetical protein